MKQNIYKSLNVNFELSEKEIYNLVRGELLTISIDIQEFFEFEEIDAINLIIKTEKNENQQIGSS